MSVYDNDTSKIYPPLDPSAPPSQEVNPQTYRLAKISEIEAYFLDEIETREKLSKKIKHFSTITAVLDTSLITTTAITGGISIAAIASGIGLPVGISLSATSLLFSLAITIRRKTRRIFNSKEKKHDDIRLLAQSKLDSISGTISQAIQDENVSPIEFNKILQATENYRRLKADIRTRAKTKQAKLSKEQREEILEQGQKRWKIRFFTKNCKYFRYQHCKCHVKFEFPPPYDTSL